MKSKNREIASVNFSGMHRYVAHAAACMYQAKDQTTLVI